MLEARQCLGSVAGEEPAKVAGLDDAFGDVLYCRQRQVLNAAAEQGKAIGVACETLHVPQQYPAEGIIEAAKAKNVDLIVMASHGRRGLSRLVIGSQANRVVTMSTVPVLIVR